MWNIPGIHLLFIIFYIVCECRFKEIDDEYVICMDADDTSLMIDGLVSTERSRDVKPRSVLFHYASFSGHIG